MLVSVFTIYIDLILVTIGVFSIFFGAVLDLGPNCSITRNNNT